MKNNSINAQMANGKSLKIAIVCDWLTGVGGAERVVLELHRMFPDSPIYTSQYDPKTIDWFKEADVRTTWLQNLPKSLKKFLPVFRAWSFSRLNLSGYDLVISSTGAEAKAVKTDASTIHVCYCHAPTHYYWSRYEDYLSRPGFPKGFNWLARLGLKALVGQLRQWDYKAAQRPDYMIANSTNIQVQIKKYYGRGSVVIHPPVDTARFRLTANSSQLIARKGYVTIGRQTPYKRIDLAVAACTQLGVPLTVIGNGPEHQKLQKMAGPTITFVTDATDADIAGYLQTAEAFIFPGLEDFGIAPVEAMAAGTPVIAYKAGGALDYVAAGKTGEFFEHQTVQSLVQALQGFKASKYSPHDIKTAAEQFSNINFQNNLQNYLTKIIK